VRFDVRPWLLLHSTGGLEKTTQTLSRRSLVTSAAALPALAVPAVAAPAEPDPIYAAIERCKVADMEHGVAYQGEPVDSLGRPTFDTPEYEEWYGRMDAHCGKHADAVREFCRTAPTTIAGIAAAFRYVDASNRDGADILGTLVERFGTEECRALFMASIHTAAERLAGQG
jgi:hypothetical protein